MQLMARFRSPKMKLTRYRSSVVPKFIAMSFAAMWITGCAPVYTVSPLIDDSTPIDKRLLGTIIATTHGRGYDFERIAVSQDGAKNYLTMRYREKDDCIVFVFRAGLFLPGADSDGWAIGELDLKRTHECHDPSMTLMRDPEIVTSLRGTGLESIENLYGPFFYKVMTVGGLYEEVIKFGKVPTKIDLDLDDVFGFYEIEESTARIVLMLVPANLSDETKERLLNGLSSEGKRTRFLTDDAGAIKNAMFRLFQEPEINLFDDMGDVLAFVVATSVLPYSSAEKFVERGSGDCQKCNLRGVNLRKAKLIGANLQGANLKEANLQGVNLQGANLQGANLKEANLKRANLRSAALGSAYLAYADMAFANLQGAELNGANLQGVNLQGVNLQGANLQGANLKEANLKRANLRSADFRSAYLAYADMAFANLQGAELNGANLQGVNLQGVNLQGVNLQGVKLTGVNLQRAKLPGANLQGANLQGAELNGANLERANLIYADLSSGNLIGANLKRANLRSADLHSADLIYADMAFANLQGANLTGGDLYGVNLIGANLAYADLTNADLSVKNLNTVDTTATTFCRTIMPDGSTNNSGC
jgi:uncharacterized protein YjbI with pentapeptide repeats